LEDLRAVVRERVAAHAAPRQLLLLDALPLRGPGKPDRAALRAAALRAGGRPADGGGTAGGARSS
ncbi:AMP-dependent synthetase, partial [Kineococcus sp. T90]|nr:AMP-dependent synthetase [Kineococcus indalonis]